MHTREDETKWNGEGRWADIVAQSNARNQTVLRPRCLESNARHSTVLYALLLRCFERSYRTCFETIPRRPLQLFRLIIIPRSVRSSDPTTLFSFSSIYFWQWFVRSCVEWLRKKWSESERFRSVVCVYPRETSSKRLFLFLSLSRNNRTVLLSRRFD